jgi:hypothetical protein
MGLMMRGRRPLGADGSSESRGPSADQDAVAMEA